MRTQILESIKIFLSIFFLLELLLPRIMMPRIRNGSWEIEETCYL